MSGLDFYMKMFGWFYRWRTRRETILKAQVRTREEVVTKKKEFERKLLLAEKQDSSDKLKYKMYLDIIKWVLKEI